MTVKVAARAIGCGVLSLLLMVVLAACGVSQSGTSQLDIAVTGLPAGVPADITVLGPDGYEKSLDTSGSVSGLSAGDYRVEAHPVSDPVGSDSYAPVEARLTVSVGANGRASVGVRYVASTKGTVSARLGLHVTEAELQIWRERAQNGPYRVASDASPTSPGDWARIVKNAQDFLADPGWYHWEGQTVYVCMEQGGPAPDMEASAKLRDAAFYYLITGNTAYRDAVKNEILALAREPGTQFKNDDIWCNGHLGDGNPALEISNWFTMVLYAYDYLGRDSFTSGENAELAEWFVNAAHFFQREVDLNLDDNFVDRLAGDYTISDAGINRNKTCSEISHYGGWTICPLAMFYNNRKGSEVRFFGLTGIEFQDDLLESRAKRFFREWVMFSMFPDGVIGEFERWEPDFPDLGWAYASQVIGSMHTLADAFARIGDTSLFDYTTGQGAYGTEGGTKSIHLAARNLGKYLDGSVKRYGTDRADRAGNPAYLIDGVVESRNWYAVHDIFLAQPNIYYQDAYIEALYTRTLDGVRPYPAHVEDQRIWSGESFVYPGVLFMWGQLEGRVWPYPTN